MVKIVQYTLSLVSFQEVTTTASNCGCGCLQQMSSVPPFLTAIPFLPVESDSSVGPSALPPRCWNLCLGLEWVSWAGWPSSNDSCREWPEQSSWEMAVFQAQGYWCSWGYHMSNGLILAAVTTDWYTSHGYVFLHLASLGVASWGVLLVSIHLLFWYLSCIPSQIRYTFGSFPSAISILSLWCFFPVNI